MWLVIVTDISDHISKISGMAGVQHSPQFIIVGFAASITRNTTDVETLEAGSGRGTNLAMNVNAVVLPHSGSGETKDSLGANSAAS